PASDEVGERNGPPVRTEGEEWIHGGDCTIRLLPTPCQVATCRAQTAQASAVGAYRENLRLAPRHSCEGIRLVRQLEHHRGPVGAHTDSFKRSHEHQPEP